MPHTVGKYMTKLFVLFSYNQFQSCPPSVYTIVVTLDLSGITRFFCGKPVYTDNLAWNALWKLCCIGPNFKRLQLLQRQSQQQVVEHPEEMLVKSLQKHLSMLYAVYELKMVQNRLNKSKQQQKPNPLLLVMFLIFPSVKPDALITNGGLGEKFRL